MIAKNYGPESSIRYILFNGKASSFPICSIKYIDHANKKNNKGILTWTVKVPTYLVY